MRVDGFKFNDFQQKQILRRLDQNELTYEYSHSIKLAKEYFGKYKYHVKPNQYENRYNFINEEGMPSFSIKMKED